jgi:hypothetical protein
VSLRDSEILALAEVGYTRPNRPNAAAVSAAAYTFAARVLRLRPTTRLLVLARDGIASLPAKPVAPAQTIAASLIEPMHSTGLAPVRASVAQLPLCSGSIDAIAEFAPSVALAVESDPEALSVLRELTRVLRRGGRYLCGGAPALAAGPPRASADKRRLDEWRPEGRDLLHHTLRLMRPDRSWRRLHERLRLRSLSQIEALLDQAGFELLNAFEDYSQQRRALGPSGQAVLLCEKR